VLLFGVLPISMNADRPNSAALLDHTADSSTSPQRRIPKRIIQTGKSADHSLRTRAIVSNLRLLNPDYEYLFFDNQQVENFIDRDFPQYRGIFDSFQFRI
jgi:mannosyltransferase OCH1-like enzyme